MSNTITTVNPTTGETLETYTLMDESQAKQIVEAAQAARAPRQGGESDWRSHERA